MAWDGKRARDAPRLRVPCSSTVATCRALSLGGKGGFVTPTENNVHGDALCFMVKTWATHKTTETALNNGWWLAVGGSWRSAVGVGWRWVVGGGWRLEAGGRRSAVGGW